MEMPPDPTNRRRSTLPLQRYWPKLTAGLRRLRMALPMPPASPKWPTRARWNGTYDERIIEHIVTHRTFRYKVGLVATKYASTEIGAKQVARTFHAVRFANDNGRPLNLMVTIDFSSLGLDVDDASAFFKETWSRVSRWWAYQRQKGRAFGSFDAYAVHEHPENGPRHVHWVMRAPTGTRDEIERVIRARIEKMTGLACLGRAVHFLDVEKPGGVAKYTLKGVHPAYARHFHMVSQDQGLIIGRRLTVSRSIGYAARQRAGWTRGGKP